jgi:hypothetical protein
MGKRKRPEANEHTGKAYCNSCEKWHRTLKTKIRHESGDVRPGILASAILRGRELADRLRPSKRHQRELSRSTEHAPALDVTMDAEPSILDPVEDPPPSELPPMALNQAQLSDPYAEDQTRRRRAWIEEVEDEERRQADVQAEAAEPLGEAQDEWDPAEDDEVRLAAWLEEMDNEVRRGIEAFREQSNLPCSLFYAEYVHTAELPLSDEQRQTLRAIAYKLKHRQTEAAFNDLPFVYPNSETPTWKAAQTQLLKISGLAPILYDCCINSCCCFAGPHVNRTMCPYCNEARYDQSKQPRRRFSYIPLIPRILAAFRNAEQAKRRRYRSEAYPRSEAPHTDAPSSNSAGASSPDSAAHASDAPREDTPPVESKVRDVFDGSHYQSLLEKDVTCAGEKLAHKFFSDRRDVPYGLSTDGYAPFRRRSKTAWPLVLYDYSLPPDIRFHDDEVLYLGCIPGPRKPIDFDSFLWPLIEEMMMLSVGIEAWDGEVGERFLLRAYLILVFGDIPAVSMVMRMKGHNGYRPCRCCNITGIREPGTTQGALYVPLDRSTHPEAEEPTICDPRDLPKRTHNEILEQAQEVQSASQENTNEALSREYGIKGVSLLSYLPSISFPDSFPFDFMHLIWENLIPNLQQLWTGKFKDMDLGTGDYELDDDDLKEIGRLGELSGAHIPYVFGARPPNFASDKVTWTAESRSFWTLYLAPVLLKDHLPAPYYQHFIDLVRLINMCLEYEMDRSKIEVLRDGFADWVTEYET